MLQIHVSSAIIDAAVTITLASSALFNVDVSDARISIIFSLLGTMVPFILLAPSASLLAERIKTSRLILALVVNGLRIIGLILMGLASSYSATTRYAIFPLAFIMLTLSKCYSVAKTSALPQVTTRESFPYFSSRLAMATSVVALIAGGILLAINRVFSESTTLFCAAAVVFFLSLISCFEYLRLNNNRSYIELKEDHDVHSHVMTDNIEIRKIVLEPLKLISTINKLFIFGGGFRFVVGAITIAIGLKYRDEKWILALCFLVATITGFITNGFAAWLNRQKWANHIQFYFLGTVALSIFAMSIVDNLVWSLLVVSLVGSLAALARVFYESRLAMILPASYNAKILSRGEVYLQLAWVFGALIAVITYSYAFVGLVSGAMLIVSMYCVWNIRTLLQG